MFSALKIIIQKFSSLYVTTDCVLFAVQIILQNDVFESQVGIDLDSLPFKGISWSSIYLDDLKSGKLFNP